jgi:hypothetical protein
MAFDTPQVSGSFLYRLLPPKPALGLTFYLRYLCQMKMWDSECAKGLAVGLWRCAAPWMALLKPYKDVFTGVLQSPTDNLSTRVFLGIPIQRNM